MATIIPFGTKHQVAIRRRRQKRIDYIQLVRHPKSFNDAEIIERALRLIHAPVEKVVSCEGAIREKLHLLYLVPFVVSDGYLSVKELREQALTIGDAASQLQEALGAAGWLILRHLFDHPERPFALVNELQRLKQAAVALAEDPKCSTSPKGGRHVDLFKRFAAGFAFELMSKFGERRPTKTLTGPYYELASVLYEGVTGIAEANLDRSCREVSERFGDFFGSLPRHVEVT